MEIYFSGYRFNSLFDIELYGLTIDPKNNADKSFRIFVEKSKINIINWLMFITVVFSIRFLNNRYIALFLSLISKHLSTRIAALKLDGVEIYHVKKHALNKSADKSQPSFIDVLYSYFDMDLYNVKVLTEYKLMDRDLLLGTNVGLFSKKVNSFGNVSILVRRASVICSEHFDDIFTYNELERVGLKTFFLSIFKHKKPILSFPGLLNIYKVGSEGGLVISISEENIDNLYSGIYLSVSLFNRILVAILSSNSNINGQGWSRDILNCKIDILINVKRVILDMCGGNHLFVTVDSVKLSLNSGDMGSGTLSIRLINSCIVASPENWIKIQDFKMLWSLSDFLMRAEIIQSRLYSKIIHSDYLNDFIDALEVPELSIHTDNINYYENSLAFTTNVEINEEVFIIKCTGAENTLLDLFDFKVNVSDLIDFAYYKNCLAQFQETIENLEFDIPQESTKITGFNVQTQLNFNSSIQVIYNMYNFELLVQRSQVNLMLAPNEIKINISDAEFVQCDYSNQSIFRLTTKSILIGVKPSNKGIVLQELLVELGEGICMCADQIVYNIRDSCIMEVVNSTIYLHLNTFLENDSTYILFEIENIGILFQKNKYSWESIEIQRLVIREHFLNDNSLSYELLKTYGDPIQIKNGNRNDQIFKVDIPKLLLQINKNQIKKFGRIISYKNSNSFGVLNKQFGINFVIILNDVSLHYYNHINNRCTTLLTHFGRSSSVIKLNEQSELIIDSKINKVEIMTGEIHLDDYNAVKLPHYSETLYSKLQMANLCCDLVYYEMTRQTGDDMLFQKSIMGEFELSDRMFPIFMSSDEVSHNLLILHRFKKITLEHRMISDSEIANSNSFSDDALILITVDELLSLSNLFCVNRAGGSKLDLVQTLGGLGRDFSFISNLQRIKIVIMKSQLDFKYVVLSLDGISCSSSHDLNLCIERFQILIKHPSQNFVGEYLNISVIDHLFKVGLQVLDSKVIFNAESLLFYINLMDLSKCMDFVVEEMKIRISRYLLNILMDVFKESSTTKKNEIVSIKYYQGSKSVCCLFDLRQSPAFISNIRLLLEDELLIVPYFQINCISNAKFSIKEVEIPLVYNSTYLLDLNHSFFDNLYSNYNRLYYSRYFNENSYSIGCGIHFGDINTKGFEYKIPFSKICDLSTNCVVVGLRFCFYSEILEDLLLVFGPRADCTSDGFEGVMKLRKGQTIEAPFDLINLCPKLKLFEDDNSLSADLINQEFSTANSINIIEILHNLCEQSNSYYVDYGSFNSRLCIGLEFINSGDSCIKVNIFSKVRIINISGESLCYSLNGTGCATAIANLQQVFVNNVDSERGLVFLLTDSSKVTNSYCIDLRSNETGCHSLLNEGLSGVEPHIKNTNYRVSLIRVNISFVILVWSPLIIMNYSSFNYMLVITDENYEYYFQGEKLSMNNSSDSVHKGLPEQELSSFVDLSPSEYIKLRIQLEGYFNTSCSRKRNNNILIETEDYRRYINDSYILNFLDTYSIKMRAIRLLPIWVIRNKSSLNIRVTYGKYIDFPVKSKTGYLDITALIGNKNYDYSLQEQINITFEGFINNYVICLNHPRPFEKLINLYSSDQTPNSVWGLAQISFNPVSNDCDSSFNAEIYIELSDFIEDVCSSYFVFENKTNFTYLVSQSSELPDLKKFNWNVPKAESLSQKIWENTLVEKFSKAFPQDNMVLSQPFSIYILPQGTSSQLSFWAKEDPQECSSLVIDCYDGSNKMDMSLGKITVCYSSSEGTRPIQFIYCDSDGNNYFCQLLLSIFRLDNKVTRVIFREFSQIQVMDAQFQRFSVQEQSGWLSIQESMGSRYLLKIKRLEVTIFIDIDWSEVLRVKRTSSPNNSPKGANKSLSLVPSPKKRDLFDFSPVFQIIFELWSISVQEMDGVNLFDSVFQTNSRINRIFCKISNKDVTIFEISNQRKSSSEEQIFVKFNCFGLKKRLNDGLYSKQYQIKDLLAKVSFIDLDLNLSIYFRNFLHNLILDSPVDMKGVNCSSHSKPILMVDFFPYKLYVKELVINGRLKMFNLKQSIEFPNRIAIFGSDSLVKLFKNWTKKATFNIIKTLLNKSLNPLIYF
ncbi:hypothetical protein OJ252_3354 [Cryptosporidium canis]|uniref:Chorein N-terminal domain-containing protein n=1 Tax=Cryptosporidium canis TaxID=195482 RepID=A0ABQ8P2M6_9CRYT|nr:hypothetical protein OJ252_3354 [Cryptosporidium canis]